MYCYIKYGDAVFKEYKKDIDAFEKSDYWQMKQDSEFESLVLYRKYGFKTNYYELYMEDDYEGLYVRDVEREIRRIRYPGVYVEFT